MKKAVFFDIDGTLVADDGTSVFPKSAIDAIRNLRKNGHYAFINTGRTMMNIEERIRSVGFDGYVCGCGTYIQMGDDVIFYRTVAEDICRKTAELVRLCNMNPLYERADKFFIDTECRTTSFYENLVDGFKKAGMNMSYTANDSDFGFDKFVCWYDESSNLDMFKRKIARDFDFIDRGYGFCELTPKGFSKAEGIKTVCKKLDLQIDDTYAVGDSLNDLEMLMASGHGIAMGNGREELFEHAEFVTTKVLDGGIETALKHFKLI